MKKLISPIVLLSIILLFAVSCKEEDPPVQYDIREGQIYFKAKINRDLRDYIYRVNGFIATTGGSCGYTKLDTNWIGMAISTASMYQGSDSFYIGCREKLYISIYTLYDLMWKRDSAFHKKLEGGNLTYFYQPKDSANPNDSIRSVPAFKDMVEIRWVDQNNVTWSSRRGKQEDASFIIESSTQITGFQKPKRQLKLSFHCTLYNDDASKSLDLTDGEAFLEYILTCP